MNKLDRRSGDERPQDAGLFCGLDGDEHRMDRL